MPADSALKRQLGFAAVMAIVMGDMLGSGIFFTPGVLAPLTDRPWQVFLIWGTCGAIVLCGALTLGELGSRLPRAGASYHIIEAGFGPLWGFIKVWMEMWVSAPGSIAGVAIVFGEFLTRFVGEDGFGTPQMWGIAAIAIFAGVNLLGVRWGGRTQIVLTSAKILGLLLLVAGALLLAEPEPSPALGKGPVATVELLDLFRLLGLGIAAVLFTYDGWTDVSHVAGEVAEPKKNLPRGLALGVVGISGLYLLVNYAYLRVVPPEAMSTTVATTVAVRSFGPLGGQLVNGLIMLSVFGALGGLVMTAPRLVYAGASRYQAETRGTPAHVFFRPLSMVSRRTAVPMGSILFCAGLSILTLIFFGTFGRLVTYILVPLQFTNILMVASVFPIRRRSGVGETTYLTPGFPVVPLVFIGVMVVFLVSAIIYDPIDTLIGVGMTASGVPVYLWINKRQRQ